MSDLLDITSHVAEVLERLGIPYTVGGSLASSFSGEPRASIDADILIRMTRAGIDPFIGALGDEFYADADALRRAIDTHASANLIHQASGVKIDLFVAGTLLDSRQLERRQRVQVASDPDRFLYVHSPEDILLPKLRYRLGGEVSDRQWRDVLSILLVRDRSPRARICRLRDEAARTSAPGVAWPSRHSSVLSQRFAVAFWAGHPGWRRCSSLEYGPVFSLVAPCQPGAARRNTSANL